MHPEPLESTSLSTRSGTPTACFARRSAILRMAIATLIVMVALAGFASAAISAQTDEATFDFEPGVSQQDADFVEEGIILAENFFTDQIGATFSEVLHVAVEAGQDEEASDLLAYWNGQTIYVLTGSLVWQQSIPAERIATIVHEFTHVYQSDMMGFDNIDSPAWFEEGVAEYLSYALLGQLGLLDHQELIAYDTAMATLFMKGISLDEVSDWRDFQAYGADVYSLSHAAIAHLFNGRPLSVITLYYTMLSGGASVDDVFSALFGTTPSAFSLEMDRYLDDWDSPGGHSVFDDLIDRPVEQPRAVSVTDAPPIVFEEEQFLITGRTDPATVCTLVVIDVASQLPILVRSTFADGTGDLFWLVTIPIGESAGLVTIEVSCGADPETRAAILG